MARYIKANPKVASYLHLENDRLQLKDGNYILWQGDMTAFGPLPMLNETLTLIGGIALMPHEAKQEQDGSVLRPLPTATDERFIIDDVKQTEATDEAPASSSEETTTDSESNEDEGETAASDESAEGEGDSESKAASESEQTESETPKDE